MKYFKKLHKFFILFSTFLLIIPANAVNIRQQKEQNIEVKAKNLLAQLTFEEKIQLVHGESSELIISETGAGKVRGVPRLGIPDLVYADSASGVRSSSSTATGFPSNLALAASWNKDLSNIYGKTIAKELKHLGFNAGLGGGLNLAREPRNGRTFEYLGEDPILAAKMVAERTKGTQSENVLATLKHFALNNQESNRFFSNSIADEKTMRETYLRPFEIAIKESDPAMIMCGYNKVNGDKACESKFLLTDVLKNQWGYKGFVQSDWIFAIFDPIKAANAGTDEDEPGSQNDFLPSPLPTKFNQKLAAAVKANLVPQARLDDMVLRKLRMLIKLNLIGTANPSKSPVNIAAGRKVALNTEENAITLLKNNKVGNSKVLPLNNSIKSIAIIGGHADKAVMGGGGSAKAPTKNKKPVACGDSGGINTGSVLGLSTLQCAGWQESSIVKSLKKNMPFAKVTYTDGNDVNAAKNAAKKADATIIVGTQYSTEQVDLGTLELPDQNIDANNQTYNQVNLINSVAPVAKKSIVVLENGTAVTMPWLNKVDAVMAAWYPGEMGGQAIANVITGRVNPSGKLPLTFPKSLKDVPQKEVSQTDLNVKYDEGTYIGYRWYESQNIKPLFPFGFGLSYTNFKYSNFNVKKKTNGDLKVTFNVSNTGNRFGETVPQIYIKVPGDKARKLISFDKVALNAGNTKLISLEIPAEQFAVWNNGKWSIPQGIAKVFLSMSADDNSHIKKVYFNKKYLKSGA